MQLGSCSWFIDVLVVLRSFLLHSFPELCFFFIESVHDSHFDMFAAVFWVGDGLDVCGLLGDVLDACGTLPRF